MSRTQIMICPQCKSSIGVGQGTEESGYIYAGKNDLQQLRRWLHAHEGHTLHYGDSELLNAYDDVQLIDPPTPEKTPPAPTLTSEQKRDIGNALETGRQAAQREWSAASAEQGDDSTGTAMYAKENHDSIKAAIAIFDMWNQA